jgi:hypothetical protein
MAVIAIDFDGTCVKHCYPEIGESIGAEEVLLKLIAKNHRLILHTMRTGAELKAAVKWFKERGIDLWGINKNPGQKYWSISPKIYAELYIDDTACGVPLIIGDTLKPYVDWSRVHEWLVSNKFLEA